MQGTFTIIKVKAMKLTTEKTPTTMYSWNTALIVNVISKHDYALRPKRRHGKYMWRSK